MADIVILGSGGFGLSLAVMCEKLGHNVTVWSKFKDEIDTIERTGELKAKLPGVIVPKSIKLTTDISCVKDKDIVVVGIPSSFVRETCEEAKPYMSENTYIVNTSKGLENGTLKRMSVVVSEVFDKNRVIVLTGPSHAEELAKGIPTTVVVSSKDHNAAKYIQEAMSSQVLRLYINDDIVGCEIGGSLKNIIALAAGICDGMGFGDNTKAALMTRGISEIARLGVSLGASTSTFAGLTGIGDLIVTCTSMHSRNRRAGILIGKGHTPEEAVRMVGTVEGYHCTKTAYALAKSQGVEMPITEQLYSVLFEGKRVDIALKELMTRPSSNENERIVL